MFFKQMVKVSIIVPIYNVEKYIDKCIQSLLNQTLEEIEIILVNDGSTDKSKKRCEYYKNKYPKKIKYYEKENGGLSSARNEGLKHITGKYIAFLDSDDYVENVMYEKLYNKAVKDNADIVECNFIWEYSNGGKEDILKHYKNKKDIIKRARVVAWNKLIKADLINKYKINFPNGLIYEDIEFLYKLIPYINKISYIDECYVHYVQREDSLSNKQTDKVEDIFKILNNIIIYYKQSGFFQQYKKQIRYMYTRILLGSSLKRVLKIEDKQLKHKLIKKTISNVILFKASRAENGKISICFGITSLGIGGAERVLVDLCNKLHLKYDITISTIYSGGELEKELNPNVKIMSLYRNNLSNIKRKFIPIYILICGKHTANKYLRGIFDIKVAFLEGPITRIFANIKEEDKLVWVHNDISKTYEKGFKSYIKRNLDKYYYSKYEKIIFVSKDNMQSFNNLYKNSKKLLNIEKKVIYNYIDSNRIYKLSNEFVPNELNKNETNIVTVCRLTKQKGIDRLIRVHKKLIKDGLNHKIYVIGDGEERENLEKLRISLDVEKTFIFLGKKENPYPYIKYADYFALLSNYEGYGMVIEEAKILKKKIIISNTAAKEALEGYKNSFVLENTEHKIYKGLKKILGENQEI